MTAVTPHFTQNVQRALSDSRLLALDLPPLSNNAGALGVYFASGPYTPGDNWNGAALFQSIDGGSSYQGASPGISKEASMGSAVTALPNWSGGFQIDICSSVRVQLYDSALTLSSCTVDQLMNGSNLAYLGGEVFQFLTAALVSAGVYDLSGLLRGIQGTERAMATHAAGEDFVLLDLTAVVDAPISPTLVDTTAYFGAVTYGSVVTSDMVKQIFAFRANRARPLSPVHAGAYKAVSNDIVIRWVRRARFNNFWANYSDVPLDEATESYRVDIMNGAVVKRSLTSSTPTVTYTAAQQTTDWGAPVSSLAANIYQLSAVVGDGWPNAFTWP